MTRTARVPRTPQTQHSRCLATGLLLLVAACGDQAAGSSTGMQAFGRDRLQGRCDSALVSTTIVATPSVREASLNPAIWRRVILDERVGRVDDVAWSPARGTFLVLDVMGHQVVEVDTMGRQVRAFGRDGDGPGEFDFDGNPSLVGTRLLAIGDSVIAVTDLRSTKLFTADGRYLRTIRLDSLPESYNFDLHTALGPNGRILLSQSGRFRLHASDSLERTALWIRELDLSSDATHHLIATADNPYARLPRLDRFPEHRPYRDAYGRTWDARGARLVVYGWEHYGVCFFGSNGLLEAAHRVDAPRVRVDAAERERVLRQAFGGAGRLPFVGKSGEELYGGKWPEYGPRYTNVLMAAEDEAWLYRRANGGRILIDVFTLSDGYQGSFTPPGGRFPRRVSDGVAVTAIWDESVELIAYRVLTGDRR